MNLTSRWLPMVAVLACGADAEADDVTISVSASDAGLSPDEQRFAEATARTAVGASSVAVAALELRIAPTLHVAQMICADLPALVIDPQLVRDLFAIPNREASRMKLAWVVAHELGHLPECQATWDAELAADQRAHVTLRELYGDRANLLVRHPLNIDFEREVRRVQQMPTDSHANLVAWARAVVHLQELIVRDGRVFTTFMRVKLSGAGPRAWYGESPFGFADALDVAFAARPELVTQQALAALEHSRHLEQSVLDWTSSFRRDDYVSTFDRWTGPRRSGHAITLGLELAHRPADVAGWRLAVEAYGRDGRWFAGSMRMSLRELRERPFGELRARTFGIELANTFAQPLASRVAITLAPSLGWEWDFQQRAPWTRARHHGVGGLELAFDARVGVEAHARLGLAVRSPIVPDPGAGWSTLAFVAFSGCVIACR